MAQAILTSAEPDRWEQERQVAREQARAAFGLDRVVDAWVGLLDSVAHGRSPA